MSLNINKKNKQIISSVFFFWVCNKDRKVLFPAFRKKIVLTRPPDVLLAVS